MKHQVPLHSFAEAFVSLSADLSAAAHPRLLLSFVRLLARYRMLSRSEHILDLIERLLIEREGFLRADIYSAATHPGESLRRIEELLAQLVGQPVKGRVRVDPTLLAGFRAQVDDLFIDASVQGNLARLRAHILQP